MERFEGGGKAGQLPRGQQVAVVPGAPAERPLPLEKGLHDEQPAPGHQGTDIGHPRAVKIIEHQNGIKGAEVRPLAGEVHALPFDFDAEARGRLASSVEPGGVAVHGGDDGAPPGHGEGVPALAAGEIQNAHPGFEEVVVPGEPRAGSRQVQGGRGRSPREVGHRASVQQLAQAPADLLVIGGGIVGAGIARDAAMRGFHTVLVEQGDFGSGTSSRSSRLIHGGLRYLEEGDFRLVFEALRERWILLRIAPHLVRPLPFVFPVHRGDRLPLWKVWAGVWLYDLLALFRNVRGHRILGKRALLRAEPMLRERGLVGGALYYDAQCDDARLVLATARSAQQHGALIANYVEVQRLLLADGRVRGAEVRDRITGDTATLTASVVVNATGPWCDRIRRLEDPGARPLLRLTKGVHVMVPRRRLGHRAAIAMTSPIDGRVMFVLPWGELSYIGTTDTDYSGSPDEVRPAPEDVVYLLRSANACFPNAHLSEADVIASWAALRALVIRDSAGLPASRVSREHVIVRGPAGLITIAGGKLTTFRVMARELVDLVADQLRAASGRARPARPATDREPLPGGEVRDFAPLASPGIELGIPPGTVDHLLAHYGTEAAAIFNLVRERRELLHPLAPQHPAIEAEVIHAARRELAQRVEDVLMRRTHVYYETPDHGAPAARRVAELLGQARGWDAERIGLEAERYLNALAAEAPGVAK